MNHPFFSSACSIAFLVSLLVAGSAHAAPVFNCTDPVGSITFTDAPCAVDAASDSTPAVKSAPIKGKIASEKAKFAAAEKARSIAASNRTANQGNLPIDVMTVRGAKASMDAMQIAADIARAKTLAEKAAQQNGWAFWRT